MRGASREILIASIVLIAIAVIGGWILSILIPWLVKKLIYAIVIIACVIGFCMAIDK